MMEGGRKGGGERVEFWGWGWGRGGEGRKNYLMMDS